MNKRLRRIVSNIYWYGYRRFVPNTGNRILIYHAFGSDLPHDDYGISISPDRFRDHCAYIARNHRVIPITSAVFTRHFTTPTLSISIDDGYADTMTGADILVANDLPFSLYVTTDFIGRPGYLTPGQLRELDQIPTCIIGTHGKSHSRLGELAPREQQAELTGSKDQLEQWLGSPVASLSYPHGSHAAVTKDLVRRAGYTVAGSSRFGVNSLPASDLLALRRTEIIASDDLDELRRKIDCFYDFFAVKESLAAVRIRGRQAAGRRGEFAPPVAGRLTATAECLSDTAP